MLANNSSLVEGAGGTTVLAIATMLILLTVGKHSYNVPGINSIYVKDVFLEVSL